MKTGGMNDRKAVIFAGGKISPEFASAVLQQLPGCFVAAADAGLRVCDRIGRAPDLLVGDFDTVDAETLGRYLHREGVRVERHNPVKNASDLELTVSSLKDSGFREILALGALGGRADHALANIRLAFFSGIQGLRLILLDEQNRISCAVCSGEKQVLRIRRSSQWGRYVSFFACGGTLSGFTLSGFRYPLSNYTLTENGPPSFTVSNEISGETAAVAFTGPAHTGLIVMETSDGCRETMVSPFTNFETEG